MLYKIAFTIGIIIAVWKGFRLFETLRRKLADDDGTPPRPKRTRTTRASRRETNAAPGRRQTVDLVPCPKCGAYVPNGTICTSIEECTHKE
ncbi:MAG: hypothetical protein R3C70_08780 [Geminicoccaceae bacterium]|nr:hypothetical protein [Geminicoccaceae bacterium]